MIHVMTNQIVMGRQTYLIANKASKKARADTDNTEPTFVPFIRMNGWKRAILTLIAGGIAGTHPN